LSARKEKTARGRITTMDFVLVVNDKKLVGSGLTRGQELLVVSVVQVPEKKNDPYLFREYVRCVRVVKGVAEMPTEENGQAIYLIDPRVLAPVSDERNAELLLILEKSFEGDDIDG